MQTGIVVVPACGCTSLMAARRRLAAQERPREALRSLQKKTPSFFLTTRHDRQVLLLTGPFPVSILPRR